MIVLYGATGYTGALVARRLAARGRVELALAGRRADALKQVAAPLGLDTRVGGLHDLDLRGADALLNCAGPFSLTAPPLLDRCLDARVPYLDLAGEVPEHRLAAARDAAAQAAGILLLPGAGFGIVPSDVLATRVAHAVRPPHSVEIALKTVGGVSRGTAEVLLGGLRTPGVRRHGGQLEPRRPGAARRRVDFGDGDGPTTVVTNPWRADLLAAVPESADLETFMTFPAPLRALMHVPHGTLLRRVATRLPDGPSDKQLRRGRSAIWARATGPDGTSAAGTVNGPDAYLFTADCVEACLRALAGGGAPPGYRTPTAAFGTSLLDTMEGVTITTT